MYKVTHEAPKLNTAPSTAPLKMSILALRGCTFALLHLQLASKLSPQIFISGYGGAPAPTTPPGYVYGWLPMIFSFGTECLLSFCLPKITCSFSILVLRVVFRDVTEPAKICICQMWISCSKFVGYGCVYVAWSTLVPVSYTHLTLPTILRV